MCGYKCPNCNEPITPIYETKINKKGVETEIVYCPFCEIIIKEGEKYL